MFLIWIAMAICGAATAAATDGLPVRLADIKVITLTAGHYTIGRRTASVPQLNCVGHPPDLNTVTDLPTTVQCVNRGSDGIEVQWECKASLASDLRFGPLSVNCEGYGYPEDPFVVAGSCMLEYTLERSIKSPQVKTAASRGWPIMGYVITAILVCIFGWLTAQAWTDITAKRPSLPARKRCTECHQQVFPAYYPQYYGGGLRSGYNETGQTCKSRQYTPDSQRDHTSSEFNGITRR